MTARSAPDGPRRHALSVLSIAFLVVLITGTAFGWAASQRSHAAATAVAAVVSSAELDPTDGLTLAPPSDAMPTSSPMLSADDAWSIYSSSAGTPESSVPSRLSVELGALTLPVSDLGPTDSREYVANNELVYAYYLDAGCLSTLPTDNTQCREWTFLDANSGQHILTFYQPL